MDPFLWRTQYKIYQKNCQKTLFSRRQSAQCSVKTKEQFLCSLYSISQNVILVNDQWTNQQKEDANRVNTRAHSKKLTSHVRLRLRQYIGILICSEWIIEWSCCGSLAQLRLSLPQFVIALHCFCTAGDELNSMFFIKLCVCVCVYFVRDAFSSSAQFASFSIDGSIVTLHVLELGKIGKPIE